MKIKIIFNNKEFEAELNKSNTAKEIYNNLPIKSTVNTWGDEIYFSIPVDLEEENSKEEVEVGDLAYWVSGNGFCIFFGRTPVSTSDKPKAASTVNVFGKIGGNLEGLKKIKDGEKVKVIKND